MSGRLERWLWNQAAAWCVLFRRRDVAIDCYRRMIARDPADTLALASLGFQLAQTGRKRESLAAFERLCEIAPADAEAQFNRGFLLQERNDHEAAMAAFRAALAANANHDRAHYGLALSLIATKRLEEAIAPLERNTKLQPMSPYGWYQLARVQFDLGRRDKAQTILDHLARFDPDVARQLERETGLRAAPLA